MALDATVRTRRPNGGERTVVHPGDWSKSPSPYSYGIKSGNTLFLSGLPVAVFFLLNVMTPNYYASIMQYDVTKIGLGCAAGWMLMGNVLMYKMCNFRI